MIVLLHLPDTSLPNIPRCCDYYWHSKRRGRLKCSPPLYLLTNLDFQKIKTKTNKQVGWRAVNIWIQLPSYFKSNFTKLWCHFLRPHNLSWFQSPGFWLQNGSVFSCVFWVFFFSEKNWKSIHCLPISFKGFDIPYFWCQNCYGRWQKPRRETAVLEILLAGTLYACIWIRPWCKEQSYVLKSLDALQNTTVPIEIKDFL